MEWVTRIIGVLAIFGLFAWSVDQADQTLFSGSMTIRSAEVEPGAEPPGDELSTDELSTDEQAEDADGSEDEDGSGSEDGGGETDGFDAGGRPEPRVPLSDPPEYLAYVPGVSPGLYQISDLPGSDDEDYELDDDDDDDDDEEPVEYDVVPGQSLAPKGDLAPGLYATPFGVRECGFELRRIMKDRTERIIGQDYLHEGRMLIEIDEIEPDSFLSLPGCDEWFPWSPPTKPLIEAGNGDYWTGDLARGGWDVPAGCYWEKVVSHRGADLFDVTDAGFGPGRVVIDADTYGLRVRSCRLPMVHGAFSR